MWSRGRGVIIAGDMSLSVEPTPAVPPPSAAGAGPDVGVPRPAPEPVVSGVASALSVRFGLSVALVRAAFATLAAAGGFGLVAYVALSVLWRHRSTRSVPPAASRDLGLGLVVTGLVWELSHWWPGVRLELVVPVGLVTAGVGMGWRGSDDAVRGDRRGRGVLSRVLGGLVLCIGGLAVFFGQQVDVATLRDTGLALGVAFAGAGLVLGPSAVRLVRSFSVERDERIRAQERARVAAHLHDSVLQTLTLIQKRAEDPVATATLARHQERSLRRWLYGGGAAGDDGEVEPGGDGWRRAAERMVGEVEDQYSVAVELVMVGDGEVDDARTPAVAALLAAAREALVNAAKFSGVPHLSMYCELADGRFEVFVRDRGKGFDPATIPDDRRGIRDSIVGRVRGVGGTANLRSEPGAGTEVLLSLPVRSGRG